MPGLSQQFVPGKEKVKGEQVFVKDRLRDDLFKDVNTKFYFGYDEYKSFLKKLKYKIPTTEVFLKKHIEESGKMVSAEFEAVDQINITATNDDQLMSDVSNKIVKVRSLEKTSVFGHWFFDKFLGIFSKRNAYKIGAIIAFMSFGWITAVIKANEQAYFTMLNAYLDKASGADREELKKELPKYIATIDDNLNLDNLKKYNESKGISTPDVVNKITAIFNQTNDGKPKLPETINEYDDYSENFDILTTKLNALNDIKNDETFIHYNHLVIVKGFLLEMLYNIEKQEKKSIFFEKYKEFIKNNPTIKDEKFQNKLKSEYDKFTTNIDLLQYWTLSMNDLKNLANNNKIKRVFLSTTFKLKSPKDTEIKDMNLYLNVVDAENVTHKFLLEKIYNDKDYYYNREGDNKALKTYAASKIQVS